MFCYKAGELILFTFELSQKSTMGQQAVKYPLSPISIQYTFFGLLILPYREGRYIFPDAEREK